MRHVAVVECGHNTEVQTQGTRRLSYEGFALLCRETA